MTKDDRIASYKYSVLQHARKHNNITYTCQTLNVSRTIYYKWLKRFSQLGYLGLQDKKKTKPKMPNRIKKDKEQIILNYIINYPTHGPKRIANELKQQGVAISDTGVYNVLRRKSLNRRLDRLFYAQEKSDNPVVTERYIREITKGQGMHISAYYPGYLFCQDTFYVGTIKGLGRIYQ
jgi:transposase